MTTVDLKELGYRDEPFFLAKDVTQVFYVQDMSSKTRKDKSWNKSSFVRERTLINDLLDNYNIYWVIS